jgi:hypothetical protein
MNTLVLTVHNNGEAGCLYSELIDLSSIGTLEVSRASVIEFNQPEQKWEVRADSGKVFFAHSSRALCLAWEIQHFNR